MPQHVMLRVTRRSHYANTAEPAPRRHAKELEHTPRFSEYAPVCDAALYAQNMRACKEATTRMAAQRARVAAQAKS